MKKTFLLSVLLCLVFFISCEGGKKPYKENNTINISQKDIKTTKRPDGVTIKYFNPIPVAKNDSYEAGLALYKNENTNQFFLTATVLFVKETAVEMSGNLLVQTTGDNGLSLSPIWHKLISMNGRNVATSMFLLTERDINDLKLYPIKLISFTVKNQFVGLNLAQDKGVIKNEFNLLNP